MLALITIVAGVCAQAVPPDADRDEAVAIARAMLIHDESIHSIEWSAEAHAKRADGQWEMFQSADHGLDERGRWYVHARVGMREDPVSPVTFSTDDRWSDDGVTQTWTQEGGKNALLHWMDLTPMWFPNVALFLGRMCSVEHQMRLGEILLAGENVRVISPENADGIVRIGATTFDDHMTRDLVVDVDTRHGFMPVRIEVSRRLMATRMEVMQVTAIEEVNGVYLPTAGIRSTFSTIAPTREEAANFEKALRQRGFDPGGRALNGRVDEEKQRDAVLEAFGPGGFPNEVSDEQRLASVKIRSVNRAIDAAKFVPALPEGIPTVDGRWEEPVVLIQDERGDIAISRAADHQDLDFYLSPKSLTLRGVCGDPIVGEVRISGVDFAKVVVRSAECTAPGMVIDRLSAGADGDQQTLRFVGSRTEPGVWTGKLKLKMGSGVQPSLEVPLSVRTLAPWRAEPAGAVVREAKPVTLALVRRSKNAPVPSRVVLDPPLRGISVSLTPAQELRVTLGEERPSRTISSLARVLSEAGEVCAVVPIVWYTR